MNLRPEVQSEIPRGKPESGAPRAIQDLLAGFTEPFLIADSDWRIVYANPEAAPLWRVPKRDLLGRTPWEMWPKAVRTEIEREHRRALKERAPVQLRPPAAGSAETGLLEVRASSCELGIAVYYHAIAKKESAESDQQGNAELQARLAAIVESSDDAILSKDLNGIIRSWNRGAERLFGYTAEEIIGKHISTLATPERVDEIPDILDRIKRGERVDHFATRRRTKDGRILSISLTVSPIRDGSGKIVGASKVARDITEREQQAQALRETNEALARSNADLEQFAYSASHDLQEPLRMVSIYSEMLRKKFGGKMGPVADEYIGYTLQGALRMEQLLKDLRSYTQASTMGEEPVEDIDAEEALDKALEGLEAAVADSGASITRAPLPRVRMHAFQLVQLFQNLIGNAIRYRSSAPPQIRIGAERWDDAWRFFVQDNGIGIDPQHKERVFGIFKRLHTAAEYPGTGMGLAICKRIVERVGGRIWLESESGRGSTFFFTVPDRRGAGG